MTNPQHFVWKIYMTPDTWHLTLDTWHLTPDMWHMVGVKHTLKMSAPYRLKFGCNDVLKVWRKRVTHSLTHSMSNACDGRTAPATPGLLIKIFLIYIRSQRREKFLLPYFISPIIYLITYCYAIQSETNKGYTIWKHCISLHPQLQK